LFPIETFFHVVLWPTRRKYVRYQNITDAKPFNDALLLSFHELVFALRSPGACVATTFAACGAKKELWILAPKFHQSHNINCLFNEPVALVFN